MKRIALLGTALVVLALVRSLRAQYRKEINHAYKRVSDGSRVLNTENGEIEYSTDGEGTPVLLIHGAGGGYDQGLLVGQSFLNGGYRLIAVSRFGYLGSPVLDDATVEKQAMLYADLLTHLDLEKVMILGLSAGGPSAMQFAHDYPEKSNALILVSPVTIFTGKDIPLSTKIVNIIQKSDFIYWLVLKTFRTQALALMGIPKGTYNSLSLDEKKFANQMLAFMHPIRPRSAGIIHEAEIEPLSGDEMSRMIVPTIVLHARDDKIIDYKHAEYYHEHRADSQLISFKSGGHVMASELEAIRGHIKVFLEKII